MMGFAQLERDTATRLNLAVYRSEDPVAGRWTSQDPLGLSAGDMDLYRYAHNGPTNRSDPSGLDDAGADGGTVTSGPGVFIPPGTVILPEGGGKPIPYYLRNPDMTVDAIVFPGCNGGLLKIGNLTDVTIKEYYPDGSPATSTSYRSLKGCPFTVELMV